MPHFLWIHPSWLVDFGVQIGVDFCHLFAAHHILTEFLSLMVSLLSNYGGEPMAIILSPGKLGTGSPFST